MSEYEPRIPESVRKQEERANQMIQQGLNPNTPQEDSEVQSGQEQPSNEAQDQQASQAGQDGDSSSAESWKHKHDVLQGKYNAEVPRLYQQNRELQQQLQQLQDQLQQLQRQQQSVGQAQSPGEGASQQEKLNPADYEDLGDEVVNLVKAVNATKEEKDALSSENRELREKLQSISNDVGSVKEYQQQDAAGRFWTELANAVPKWEQINQDQEFLNWLAETNPWTGTARNDALQEAHQALDASRVAAIFNDFITSTESGQKYREQAAQQQRQKENKRPQNVQPSKTRAEQQPSESKPAWSAQQIKEFYDKVRRGMFKGREEEMKKTEQDIFQAQKEGRISL